MGNPMLTTFNNLLRAEPGATAVEYGLIAALVSVAIIGVLQFLGASLERLFSTVTTALANALGI
jgi:pilus assembly protein Flp/PilA